MTHHSAEMEQNRCFNEDGSHLICPIIFTSEFAMNHQDNSSSKAFRKPRRVTITIPHATYLALERRSYEQGRSLSNLSAYLLECAINGPLPPQFLQTLSPPRASRDGHLSH